MKLLDVLFVIVLGMCLGSFGHVVAMRYLVKENWVWKRSHCFCCQHKLMALDLIPLISWILLKGRCRYCQERIPIRYCVIECIGGMMSYLCFSYYGYHIMSLITLVFGMLLLVIAYIDYFSMLIPHRFLLCCFFLGVLRLCLTSVDILDHIIAFFIMSVPMFMITFFIIQGFGGGDIKLLAVCGFFMGTTQVIVGVIIAILIATIHVSYLLADQKIKWKDTIAFAPYLSIGIFISCLYGNDIIRLYLLFL